MITFDSFIDPCVRFSFACESSINLKGGIRTGDSNTVSKHMRCQLGEK
jgi:hypothetical protein